MLHVAVRLLLVDRQVGFNFQKKKIKKKKTKKMDF